MALLLGIDIGTSSAKAVLFDPDTSSVIAAAGREYDILRPLPDRSEQHPEAWWGATVGAARAVLAHANGRTVAGIGLCGQMHGTVLLDGAHMPLGDAIIWSDQRAAAQVDELIAPFGAARFAAIAGTLPAAGFMGVTLLWLKAHLPARLEQAKIVLFPKDYVRFRLTGELATDASDAASSALFDVRRGRWSPEIIGAAGLPESLFPPLLGSAQMAGTLTASAAAALGLPADTAVVTGCADQPAQALANGLTRRGRASITVGSGGQVFCPLERLEGTDSRLHVFNHAVPQRWYVLGATLSAGLSLRWLRGILGGGDDASAYAALSEEARRVPPGANGLLFLPHLTGERTPHMDARARGAFIGLSAYHERGHLVRAVMEGVAFSLRQALELSIALGGAAEMIVAAGGGMEDDGWRGIMADVVGLPLRRSMLTETTAVGAALLAGVGAGIYPDMDAASAQTAQYASATEPNPAHRARYDALYEQYLTLFPMLKADFHRLSDLN